MHVIINRIHFGNLRFIVELETGRECPGRITLWVAEKVDVEEVELREFALEQLLYAVKEPLRSQLYQQLENEKRELEQRFAGRIAIIEQRGDKGGKRARQLRHQQDKALLQLQENFRQKELLTLGREQYNRETLQAESHLFKEERFLSYFWDGEIEDAEIRQLCFQFAFDGQKRAEMLAEAAHQRQPEKPEFEFE